MASLPPDLQSKSLETAVFAHRGQPLAIVPSALGLAYAAPPPEPESPPIAAVVRICGPITHEPDPKNCFDFYDAITARVTRACSTEAATIVLWINSPGGDVAGAFDCARAIKASAKAAGKRLIAFTEGRMCSAAYALGCAADEIIVSDTAEAGSVGTIVDLCDASAALAAQGISHRLVVSGARKGDASPVVALADGAVEAVQRRVDEMAGIFFGWVAQNRPLKAAAVEALQADIFVGAQAVTNGLADRVMSWRELVASLEAEASIDDSTAAKPAPTGLAFAASPKSNVMAKAEDKKDDKGDEKKEDSMRASLVVAAESDDPDKKSKAQRALAAYDADEAGDKDDKKEKKDAKASASSPDAGSAAAIAGMAASLASKDAEIAALRAAAQAPALSDAEKRAAVFAGRPDLSATLVASLAAVPTQSLAGIVSAIPKASFTPDPAVIALGAPSAPRGAAAEAGFDPDSLMSAEDLELLNAAYDTAPAKPRGVVNDGPIQRFGVPVRVN